MRNLSQTTIFALPYQNAIDKAIQAVQMGIEDYNTAVRRAIREAAEVGLRINIRGTSATEARVSYGGTYTRRLDSAVRQNVLDGIRSLGNSVRQELGEEFGADGIELSAHALCAPDHLPHQGQQFSLKAFEKLQASLRRPFFKWNCKHSMHPILLGISEPVYTEEELESFKKNSNELIEIDGVKKTRYEWTQEQRRVETAIRREKDVGIAAQAAGDNALRREAQTNINALTKYYEKISEKAGVSTDYSRTRVEGFKEMGKRELQKAVNSDKIESTREIIRSDSVLKTVNPEKQNRHIKSSQDYVTGRSYIYGDLQTAQSLVDEYSGTGEILYSRKGKWKNKELIYAKTDVGVDIEQSSGKETPTNRFVIHYSKTGTHIVPTSREE